MATKPDCIRALTSGQVWPSRHRTRESSSLMISSSFSCVTKMSSYLLFVKTGSLMVGLCIYRRQQGILHLAKSTISSKEAVTSSATNNAVGEYRLTSRGYCSVALPSVSVQLGSCLVSSVSTVFNQLLLTANRQRASVSIVANEQLYVLFHSYTGSVGVNVSMKAVHHNQAHQIQAILLATL